MTPTAKREVQVVKCPSAFPISSKPSEGKKRPREVGTGPAWEPTSAKDSSNKKNKKDTSLLDWHDTVKEIRAYGAKAFEGKQKRDFQDEEYFKLTGRHKKKPQTPLPIVRGIKKAAAKREAKARQEAREAGIILPKAKTETKKSDSTYQTYGPAPSIGFMKQGIYRVQNLKKKR
jgi:hypothetical protein